MCGHIQRGAFADLRLGRRREHHIDCEVLQPMEWVCNQMKRTTGFVAGNRGMVIDQKLTGQLRGEYRVDGPPMQVICSPMAMIGLGMDMDQWHGKHPEGRPHHDHHPRPHHTSMYHTHCGISVA